MFIQNIVDRAQLLNAQYTDGGKAPVNYARIFAQDQTKYDELLFLTRQIGTIVDETTMGPVFQISPITTIAGDLFLLKIRHPDPKRPEQGDADFTIADYPTFKQKHLGKPGFSLIKRKNMEMLELKDPNFSVLAYYSHPTLAEVLQIIPRPNN